MNLFRLLFLPSALAVCIGHAHAQNATVVAVCGTPPTTYTAGETRPVLQDTTGKQCVGATVTPGGTQNVNVAQVNGATVNVGTGASSTGTQRVTTSTDSTIGTVTAVTAITNALPAGTNIVGKVGIDQTTDVTTNGVEIAPTAGAAAGVTPVVAGSSASSAVLKASAGNLYSAYVTTGATQGWLMVFNATALPSNGATTAGTASGNMQECIYAPANTTTAVSFNPGPAEPYTVGITAAFSSTGCGTLTASATAFIHGSAK